jgi:hypothetical protein
MSANRKPTQLESLAAGVIAGAVEGAATYPAEFLKTKAQFASSKGQPVSVCASELTAERRFDCDPQQYRQDERRGGIVLWLGGTDCGQWIEGGRAIHDV